MEKIHVIVGRNIKRHRERIGLTQEGLAERCELTPQFIAAIEVGLKTPSLDTIEKIVKVMQIRPYELFLTVSEEDIPASGVPEFADRIVSLIEDLATKYSSKKD